MNTPIEQLIKQFNMIPHPEGGFFVETYRSELLVADSQKCLATVIYFLLPSGKKSSWHRITTDEFWFYHGGSPIIVHEITPDGAYKNTVVGMDVSKGQQPQYLVPGGAIFGASVLEENNYSLVSCVVTPGFDFEDFELF